MPPTSTASCPISSATSTRPLDGFLTVDKPGGPTSHDVVACVRKAFDTRRVGHTGTLDPFATGLLLVLVGRATRLTQFMAGLPKRYTGTIRLGLVTDTDDLTGEPIRTSEAWRDLADREIGSAMEEFLGRSQQQPPLFSAKKVAGRPAHRRARRGEIVTLEPQWVQITRFRLEGRNGSDVTFEAEVGTGVYLRAMARDLGERLGCGAHLCELRRVAIGPFSVDDALSLDTVVRGSPTLRPAGDAVAHLETVRIDEVARAAVRQGRPIPGTVSSNQPVALLFGDELVGVAEPVEGALQPRVVLDA